MSYNNNPTYFVLFQSGRGFLTRQLITSNRNGLNNLFYDIKNILRLQSFKSFIANDNYEFCFVEISFIILVKLNLKYKQLLMSLNFSFSKITTFFLILEGMCFF